MAETMRAVLSAEPSDESNNDCIIFGKKELLANSAISPLQVNVTSGGTDHHEDLCHIQEQKTSSMINGVATDGFVASSPASSVDSGMSSLSSSNSSASSSPGCSPVSVHVAPFHYDNTAEQHYSPQQVNNARGRSTSESLTPNSGLKSILKKSPTSNAGRFARSVSECHAIKDEDLKVVYMDETNVDNAASECASRKKHVSFSERLVQERSFRSSSSILGQKKKNRRKQKNKMRKKEALAHTLIKNSKDGEMQIRENSEKANAMNQNTVTSTKENDVMDPIVQDLASCKLDDDFALEKSEKNETGSYQGTTRIQKNISNSAGVEQHW